MTIVYPTIDHIYQIDCVPRFMWSYYPILHQNRKSPLPSKGKPWILDSGGFSFLKKYGKYPMSEAEYFKHALLLNPYLIVSMDWMCEPTIIKKTGLSVKKHIENTVFSLWTILNHVEKAHPKEKNGASFNSPFFSSDFILGVIQGWSIEDYLFCIDLLREQGLILPYMGVGTLCRRNSEKQIIRILRHIKRELPDVKLHGFGVKTSVLRYPEARELLYSVDSAAWGHYCYNASGKDAKSPILIKWYREVNRSAQLHPNQTKLFR
jgi:hypothetical protein